MALPLGYIQACHHSWTGCNVALRFRGSSSLLHARDLLAYLPQDKAPPVQVSSPRHPQARVRAEHLCECTSGKMRPIKITSSTHMIRKGALEKAVPVGVQACAQATHQLGALGGMCFVLMPCWTELVPCCGHLACTKWGYVAWNALTAHCRNGCTARIHAVCTGPAHHSRHVLLLARVRSTSFWSSCW